MTGGAECIGETQSVEDAARRLAELDVGAMPICGEDDRLKGMLTDRDIVVKVIAQGRDPSTVSAGELGQGKPITVDADTPVDQVMAVMKEHQVRRLPVIEDHRLVGIISQADLARSEDPKQVGEVVEAISV